MFTMRGRQLLLRTFRQRGGRGKNPWVEPPCISWDGVERPAKDQNRNAEIGLSVRGQPAACRVGALEDQEPKQEKSGLKHGGYTKEAKAQHKEVMNLIKASKDILNRLN